MGRRDINDAQKRAQGAAGWVPHYGLQPAQQDRLAGQDAYQQGRGLQQDVYGMMGSAAAGNTPSVAQQQLQAGSQANLVNQMGAAAQARGGTMAAQQRSVQGMGSAAAMGLNQQQAQLRAQEMEAARGQLAAQANTMAGQDFQQMMAGNAALQQVYGQQYSGNVAMQQAQFQRQMDLYNAEMQKRQMNREFGMGVGQMGLQAADQAASIIPFL